MSAAVDTSPYAPSCGCGEAQEETAPLAVSNRPGLSSIAYRVGTHASFRAAMIAALSRSDLPQLAALTTREPSDFSIALLDAWATVADVLTFYQERIANEAYLRTATERLSVAELAALIGYAPRPGVAASTLLAFDLEDVRGAPDRSLLDVGMKVQSVPGAGETPQTFETIEKIEGRPLWNGLRPRLSQIALPFEGQLETYLQGTVTGLKPGDAILIVGGEREHTTASTNWDFRRVTSVDVDLASNRTLVAWTPALGKNASTPAAIGPRIFAFRQRASLFGHNAPEFKVVQTIAAGAGYTEATWAEAALAKTTTAVNLDAVYPSIAVGSWLVLAQEATGVSGYTELYQVSGVAERSAAQFMISGKCTQVTLDGSQHIDSFAPRYASAFVQTEELQFAEGPYRLPGDGTALSSTVHRLMVGQTPSPVEGSAVTLDRYVEGITPGKKLVVSGKRLHVEVSPSVSSTAPLSLTLDGDPTPRKLGYREVLEVLAPPVPLPGAKVQWRLRTLDKRDGSITTDEGLLRLRTAPDGADVVSEPAVVQSSTASVDTSAPTTLALVSPLASVYDRASVTLYANVAAATHGETVHEVLGSGDAGTPYQTFALKQSPLTYVRADNARGAASTLGVTIQGLRWHEVDGLYGAGPSDRVYVASIADDGTTSIEFGDGHEGARVPTGNANVLATYRKGIGLAGNVGAGKLTLLAARPLGLRGVTNPLAAAGGDDPETLGDARTNAGLTIQTLDRVVSIQDYAFFARAFAAVAKASAEWVWDGYERCVLVTLAGAGGALVDAKSDLHGALIGALQKAGDPFVPIVVVSYRSATFRLGLQVRVDEDSYVKADVLAAVEARLRAWFAFDARSFGQTVTLSEVTTVAQEVEGVVAVRVTRLHRTDDTSAPLLKTRLVVAGGTPPHGGAAVAQGAELLTLDPAALEELGDMA